MNMDLTTTELLLLTVFLITIVWFLSGYCKAKDPRMNKLPPGPVGLPFLGSIWLMWGQLHKDLTKMADKWGDVFSFKVMGDRVVVLNSADSMRAAFTRKEDWEVFAGRPYFYICRENLINGVIFSQPTPLWSKLRKLSHKFVHNYAEGPTGYEGLMQEELNHFADYLEKHPDTLDITEILHHSLVNIMTIMLKGNRLEYDDEALNNIARIELLVNNSLSFGATTLMYWFPFLKYIPIGLGKDYLENRARTETFFKDYFEEPKATFDAEITRGLMDFLFRTQMESTQEDGSVWLEDKNIKAVCEDMMLASVLTTTAALHTLFLDLLHKPDVTKNVQAEIDNVIGSGRLPRLQDRVKMPYTMAVIHELLRHTAQVPLVTVRTTTEVTFRGFFIPENTTIIGNIWRVQHDPTIFQDPWEFKPERFIGPDGNLVNADHPCRKNLIAFGIGRRKCIGENLAFVQLFMFATTLLQRFNFLPDLKRPNLPSCDPRSYKYKETLNPEPYTMCVKPR